MSATEAEDTEIKRCIQVSKGTEAVREQLQANSNSLLRKDVKFLGTILGEILISQAGHELFRTVEKIREMSKSLRASFDPELFKSLKETIRLLKPETRYQVIRPLRSTSSW